MIEQLKEKIRLAKFKPEMWTPEWPYHNGFNGALELVERFILELERGNTDERRSQQQRTTEVDHGAD